MKRLILIIFLIVLTGCGVFNLDGFIIPDDPEFLTVVESLDTPVRICQYMQENFTYKLYRYAAFSPYMLWKTQKGDCNDFSTFAVFCADWHGYKTCQIRIFFKDSLMRHSLGVFVENGKYTYSSNRTYHPINVDTFEEIVSDCINKYGGELSYFEVSNG